LRSSQGSRAFVEGGKGGNPLKKTGLGKWVKC